MASSLDGSSLLGSPEKARRPRPRNCVPLLQQVQRLREEYLQYAAPGKQRVRDPPAVKTSARAAARPPRSSRPLATPPPPPRRAPAARASTVSCATTPVRRSSTATAPSPAPRRPRVSQPAATRPRPRPVYADTVRGLARRVTALEDESQQTKRWKARIEATLAERENVQKQLATRILTLAREATELSCCQELLRGRLDGMEMCRTRSSPPSQPLSPLPLSTRHVVSPVRRKLVTPVAAP
eukprot:TRINITY_DN3076_c4_g1_i1.p1 TRINITY_DN3076_c4_g1~~TRINITY_DN3076_c4_g1_i1.p1  ORF type:complete len:240 (+),score=42.41 TRINITY_DN3076_c4_g1_i1:57-776(+)